VRRGTCYQVEDKMLTKFIYDERHHKFASFLNVVLLTVKVHWLSSVGAVFVQMEKVTSSRMLHLFQKSVLLVLALN